MTDLALGRAAYIGPSVESVKRAALGLGVFLGAFVVFEPAPFEFYFALVLPLWFIAGLKLRAGFGPLVVCFLLFTAGGFLSTILTREAWFADAILYVLITGFLVACAILFAAVLAEDWRRFRTVERAYIAGAACTSTLGIVAYFGLIPNAEQFMLNLRASGGFQDPNVFGPFLIMPSLLLARRFMTRTNRHGLWELSLLLVLVLGVFLSFSRAAWGMLAMGLMLQAFVAFSNFRSNRERFRLAGIAAAGIVAVVVMLLVVVSLPGVGDLLAERARLVQDYDSASGERLGRFARHIVGAGWATSLPLGIGPWEFPIYFIEATHNTYLKGFLEYGWLGGLSYLTLCLWTLIGGFPLLFRQRPWQGFYQAAYITFVMHLVVNMIIDTDHWRHVYMIFGLLWGLMAAEKQLAGRGALVPVVPVGHGRVSSVPHVWRMPS